MQTRLANARQALSERRQERDRLRQLRDQTAGELAEDKRTRLESLEITLDQARDLLRQRRALREFGEDAGRAHARDATTIERYEQ